jgi:hypothetical protein
MKNKLLLSSALVGSLAIAGAAVAETKITGSASYTYSAISGSSALTSTQGYGSEVQLDISNSGDLNIGGLTYKAGFSMEKDGSDSAGDWGEGNYFSVVSGKTELMFNRDKAPNLSQSATPRVGQMLNTQAGSTSLAIYDYSPGTLAKDQFNVAILQGTDIGNFALVYAPKVGDTGANNDKVIVQSQSGGSVTDFVYSGNLGVDGLSAVAGYSKMEKQAGDTDDTTAKQIGIGYNFGSIAAGVTRNKATASSGVDTTSTEYGVTFAANDNLSLGLLYGTGDKDGTTAKEKATSVTAAYNLGGAALEVYYIQVENAAGSSSAKDEEKAAVRISTKF